MKRVLPTAVTGQDGSYLTEVLPAKGVEAHGTVGRSSASVTDRIGHLFRDPHDPSAKRVLAWQLECTFDALVTRTGVHACEPARGERTLQVHEHVVEPRGIADA